MLYDVVEQIKTNGGNTHGDYQLDTARAEDSERRWVCSTYPAVGIGSQMRSDY